MDGRRRSEPILKKKSIFLVLVLVFCSLCGILNSERTFFELARILMFGWGFRSKIEKKERGEKKKKTIFLLMMMMMVMSMIHSHHMMRSVI